VRSYWMTLERERGISVSSAVIRANAIRRFHPCVVSYEGEIHRLAGVAVNGGGALAAPAGGLHPPYALVFDYVAAFNAGAPVAAIAGQSRSTMWLP
jgi:hypothetical protein